MRLEERFNDIEELLRLAMDGRQSQMHTGQPGIIVSFDSHKQTAVVQPAVKGKITKPDGTIVYQALPVLLDVPISFPSGGGATLTFPIKAGDECWIAHGHRDISYWWQNGGTQPPLDARMHDLSDAVAHVGIRSQARRLAGGASSNTTQLRSDDGSTYVELAGGQIVNIVAPGGVTITAPFLRVNGDVWASGDLATQSVGSYNHHVHPSTGQPTAHPTPPPGGGS